MRQGLQDMHRLQELVRLHRQGRGPVETARLIGLDRKTERRYRKALNKAGLLAGEPDDLPPLNELRAAVVRRSARPPQERSSVADFTEDVRSGLVRGLGPTAIHALLAEEHSGFNGSLSAIKRLYKQLKTEAGPRADQVAIPVHTVAGQQAQVDFGYVGLMLDPQSGKRRKAWVFVMVLSHSRFAFARVVFDQGIDTWLDLHRQAFEALGGVPNIVVPDNLKSAVIRAVFDAEGMGTLNRSYRELARHYGFAIDPTPAYSPEKKGKVEAAVKYIKRAFFAPRADRFTNIDDANRRLDAWMRDTANVRVHGTTQKVPAEVLRDERHSLLGLPAVRFTPVFWHKATVGRNSHVVFRKRFYSAPWTHLGQEAWLRITGNSLTIYVSDERVANHRVDGSTPWSTVSEHMPEGRRDFADRDPNTWYERADTLGDDVGVYVRAIMGSDEVHYPLRRVQSIVRTLEGLPIDRAQSVARHAARFACFRPEAVRRIVAQGNDLQPADGAFVSPKWASQPRFARQAEAFLKGGRHECA
ncbi:MAG: IS21 family transposase [Myxococcota bacterium]